jgi:hypothetical protein
VCIPLINTTFRLSITTKDVTTYLLLIHRFPNHSLCFYRNVSTLSVLNFPFFGCNAGRGVPLTAQIARLNRHVERRRHSWHNQYKPDMPSHSIYVRDCKVLDVLLVIPISAISIDFSLLLLSYRVTSTSETSDKPMITVYSVFTLGLISGN